eukprot:g2826.t1
MPSPLSLQVGKKYLAEYVQFGYHSQIIREEFEQCSIIFREKAKFSDKYRCGIVVQGTVGLYQYCSSRSSDPSACTYYQLDGGTSSASTAYGPASSSQHRLPPPATSTSARPDGGRRSDDGNNSNDTSTASDEEDSGYGSTDDASDAPECNVTRAQLIQVLGSDRFAEVDKLADWDILSDLNCLGFSDVRTVTAVALSDEPVLVAWVPYNHLVSPNSANFAITETQIEDMARMVNVFRKIKAAKSGLFIPLKSFFDGCRLEFIYRLASRTLKKRFGPLEVIFEEGDKHGNSMCIVYRGAVQIELFNRSTGSAEMVKKLSEGEIVGELAVLGISRKRTATVRACSAKYSTGTSANGGHQISNKAAQTSSLENAAGCECLVILREDLWDLLTIGFPDEFELFQSMGQINFDNLIRSTPFH